MQADIQINARWVAPLSASHSRTLLNNQAVFVKDGKILAIQDQQATSHEADQVVELTDHLLLPGYVNAHGHAAMSLFRGLADDLPLMTWLNEHI